MAVGGYCSSQRLYFISYLAYLIIFFNKKHLIIKMAPHFDTYHWNKNTVHGCQNTVQNCKISFDTLFLTTPIGVALNIFNSLVQRCPVWLFELRLLCNASIWRSLIYTPMFGFHDFFMHPQGDLIYDLFSGCVCIFCCLVLCSALKGPN